MSYGMLFLPMKHIIVLLTALLLSSLAFAQAAPSHAGASEWDVWTGGGTGLGRSTGVGFYNLGVRWGKVLTAQHGPGLLRGNLEYAADVMPVFLVFDRGTTYGASIAPVNLKWNFTRGGKFVPFGEVEGGILFHTRDVPPGDTSTVNFQTGVGGGVQIFRRPTRSITLSTHFLHISNASLGNRNPSYNITMQFRVGYQWWGGAGQ